MHVHICPSRTRVVEAASAAISDHASWVASCVGTGTATLPGQHYQVDGAIGRPLPIQDGGIPLWIAGGGEKKTLRIAAKYAKYTNFDATPDVFRRKSEILAEHCQDAGTDFDAITRSANFNVIIGETENDVADKLAWVRAHYEPLVPAESVESYMALISSGPLVGTPEQIVERLAEVRDLGLGYAIGYFVDAAYDRGSIDLFADKVIPALAD